jgi:hypothetical protein
MNVSDLEARVAALEAALQQKNPKFRLVTDKGHQIVCVGRYAYTWPGPGQLRVGDRVVVPLSWVDRAQGNTSSRTCEVTSIGSDYDGELVSLLFLISDKEELILPARDVVAYSEPKFDCCGNAIRFKHRYGCPKMIAARERVAVWQSEFYAQNKPGPRCYAVPFDGHTAHCVSYHGHPEGKHWFSSGCPLVVCETHKPETDVGVEP